MKHALTLHKLSALKAAQHLGAYTAFENHVAGPLGDMITEKVYQDTIQKNKWLINLFGGEDLIPTPVNLNPVNENEQKSKLSTGKI